MDLEKASGIKKFDGTEFDVWSTLQEVYLRAKNIWYVIDEPKPEAADTKWENANRQAKMALLWSLEHEIVKLVISCDTARDIWNRLKAVHAQKSESCRMILYQEFYACNMEPGQRVSDYVAKVEFIGKKLRNSGATIDDETLISKVVTGLSQDYKHFMTAWMSTAVEDRTFDNLLPRLLAEEAIVKPEQKSESVAMKMKIDKGKNSNNNNGSGKGKDERVCYHCGEKGHIKRKCRKLKKEHNKESGSQDDKKKFAIMARTGPASSDGDWVVDSGASEHMTGNHSLLDNYKVLDKKVPIRVGNNEYVYGVGTGSLKVISTVDKEQYEVTISDVMYVPGISDNLFSAGMADERGLTLRIAKGRMEVIHQDTVIMLGHKSKGSNLYKLDIQVPARACVARAERTIDEWHRVLGHPGIDTIQNLQRKGCTQGFKIVEEPRAVADCADCQTGKAHQVPHPLSTRVRANDVLERIHVDLVGQVTPTSLGGSRYFMLVRDEFSTYLSIFFLASKSQVVDLIQQYIIKATTLTQKRVRIIRSDNGSEFRNVAMTHLCQTEGIIQEFSSPRTPEQNGEIERANRTVIESTRAMLLASGLPANLWGEAAMTAVFLKNRLTNKRTLDQTPYEMFHGRKPDYSHLIEFGKQVHVLNKAQHLTKFQSRTTEAFMVGYTDRLNTYRCFSAKKNDVFISSDVFVAPHKTMADRTPDQSFSAITIENYTFDDGEPQGEEVCYEEPLYRREAHAVDNDLSQPPNDVVYSNNEALQAERADQIDDDAVAGDATANCSLAPSEHSQPREMPSAVPPVPDRTTSLSPPGILRPPLLSSPAPVAVHTVPRAMPQGGPVIQRPSSDFADRARTSCVPASNNRPVPLGNRNAVVHFSKQPPVVIGSAPANVGAARQVGSLSPRSLINRLRPTIDNMVGRSSTDRATDSESRNMLATTAIDFEPTTYDEAVTCADQDKWKIAICEELAAHADNGTWELVPKRAHMREITAKWIFKIKDEGDSKRYKARLVARGFSQKEGTDYNDIFAPVVRTDSVRLLFSLAVQIGLKWQQFDITTAFLNGDVKEELYLTPPEGLSAPDDHTCRLKRSLYGLKQAPRCWNAKFTQMLSQFGMHPTQSDPCVYVTTGVPTIYLALYVDDGLIFSQDQSAIDNLLAFLKKHFKVKVINSACFLGLEIKKNADGSILLHQTKYINRMLVKYNMVDCKEKPTPLQAGHVLNRAETLKEPVITGVPYVEALGSLLYCCVATRPDISYTMSVLCKYQKEPREAHWTALKRVLRYLSATRDFGLLFARRDNPKVECYTDADYAGDHENRRSTSGMVTFLTSGPISYRARQQKSVTLSTTEAEYIASAEAAKELVWLQRFLVELNVELKHKPELLCDNQSALRLIKNPEFHQRSKHIDIAYHFVRDKYEEGLFVLKFVGTEDQKADIFTKAFTEKRFKDLRDAIGCVRAEVSSS
jgi:hypothetical protein